MGARWDYYPEGKRISGVKILERICGGDARDSVRYDVVCLTCGTRMEMTHKYIGDRERKRVEGCSSCRAKLAAYARQEKALRQDDRPEPEGAIRAGQHLWWPMRGPMGGRNDRGRWTRMPGEVCA